MLKPYYDQNGITIFHGDCLDVLRNGLDAASQEFDAVVTDVPYASGVRSEAAKSSSGSMVRGRKWGDKPITNDQMTNTGFVWFIREVCYASIEMLTEGGAFVTFIDWRQWPSLVGAVESTNMRVNNMGVWDKQTIGMGRNFRNQHELFMFASKGKPTVYDSGVGNVLSFKRDPIPRHPSPKPTGLMEKILQVVTPEGGAVIDPCMGAGSTLVAAKSMGRRAVGIEIEEQHCETAAERLSQGALF